VKDADSEPRRRSAGSAIFAISMIAMTSYLTFAALQGEYGLFRMFQIEAQEARLRSELTELQIDRAAIANKTRRLSVDHLDLELLDEQSRKVLGLGRRDEVLIR
jgi:cell division protein FtsB